ncbi:MAG: hypothetical protein KC561_00695, partial [Myxococcales bacterium]|nr:hypothetical protein [Myxococcales bacterium]
MRRAGAFASDFPSLEAAFAEAAFAEAAFASVFGVDLRLRAGLASSTSVFTFFFSPLSLVLARRREGSFLAALAAGFDSSSFLVLERLPEVDFLADVFLLEVFEG